MLRSFLILLTLIVALPAYAQDTCDYANDNECDESRYGGQGYCDAGTDTTDCALVSQGIQNDSCDFANDNECDEYRFGGTGACLDGSDTADCAAWVVQRESDFMDRARALGIPEATIGQLGDNTCRWSYDGECDDIIYGGTGACDPGTDAADCIPQAAEQTGATPAAPSGGNNSCVFANDNECDEARYGGAGFCDEGTDTNDCAAQAQANASPAPTGGDNSCVFANDNECDETRYGGAGFCEDGTDTNDCAAQAQSNQSPVPTGGDNSCVFANDNECDETRYGGAGFCEDGTDTNDCSAASGDQTNATPIPQGDNSCVFANDNECDEEQYGGAGFCEAGTDTADCTEDGASLNLNQTLSPLGGNDSCEYANDSECDEARYGGGDYCAAGTDTTDCRQLALGLDDDSCQWANDGACDEMRYGGGGQCIDGTDATDCDLYGTSPEALARLLDLVPADLRASLGDDSCQYAADGECDDTTFGGTTYCNEGTDASDCRALALGGEDSCRWANDGECDEPGIGTNNCTSGTDMTDCADVAYLRNRADTCNTAFDGVCNEPSTGDGTCEIFSDTADCLGRSRPAGLENHFFGRDDRILVDATQMPWRTIGSLELQEGFCTGTLVGPSLVLTAAHCVTDNGEDTLTPVTFTAGMSLGENVGVAKVTRAVFDPAYNPNLQPAGGGNGHDWALVVLDRPLGNDVGFLEIHELGAAELSQIGQSSLLVNQAGYSWDTGDNLSGNVGCRIIEAFEDNSILHECDTAQGDSGSPFLLNIDGGWKIIGVDSTFFEPQDDKTPFGQSNLAVDSRAFASAVRQQQ